jgi:CPA1 family monovalent cation:H+ antiporter
VIIGLEVLVMTFTWGYLVAGLAAIPLVLLGRFLAVGGVVTLLKRQHEFTPHAIKVMTWGGLRGGISIALALSLPPAWGAVREAILTMAYTVVVFSIIVQGLTMPWLVRRIPVAAG